tara:strand:+ start:1033 stop:1236 length:204 start_codon:yes stop_codon:yes gene_type:complete
MVNGSIALLIGIYRINFFETQPIVFDGQEAKFIFQQFQTQMKNISTHLNNGESILFKLLEQINTEIT